MPDQKMNDEMEERELYELLGDTPRVCPSAAVLRAHLEEALPAEMEAEVSRHLERCAICSMLAADLALMEDTPATQYQLEQIGLGLPLASDKAFRWKVFASLAATLLLCASVGITMHRRHEATAAVAMQEKPDPATVAALEIPLAPLAAPAADQSSLQTRGHASPEPSISELMPAFKAYNAADYSSAARRFAPLARNYPESTLVDLYFAVSQLELHEDADAAQSLAQARMHTAPRFADDVTWYSAIAAQRIGNLAQARAFLEQLCRATSSRYSEQSCRIAPTLSR